jgi:hypothetical protein
MDAEAAFLAGYALALTFVAVGLESLGRRSTDPWESRTLAASRPPAERRRSESSEWPDSEVASFHLGLSAVALAAAFAITTVSIVRNTGAIELVTHGGLLVIIAARVRHLIARHRAGSADLTYSTFGPPRLVSGPHVDVETMAEGEAESIGE